MGWMLAGVFLSVLGLIELLRWVVFWLTVPGRRVPAVLYVVIEREEDCEQILRATVIRLSWMGMAGRMRIYVIDRAKTVLSAQICQKFGEKYDFLYFA